MVFIMRQVGGVTLTNPRVQPGEGDVLITGVAAIHPVNVWPPVC